MTPEQKVKWLVLANWAARVGAGEPTLPPYPCDGAEVEARYSELKKAGFHWDAMSEVRDGQVRTGLPSPYGGHYETESVAAQMPDGTWVGWTYYYGGGKHGSAWELEWMDDAYDVTCREEQVTKVVQVFTRKGGDA